jgi:hypothetical protein
MTKYTWRYILSKHRILMKDVICVHHPLFCKSPDLISLGHTSPEIFNVEMLTEQTMAHVGNYAFINNAHADFSDGSDCKTSSISESITKNSKQSFRGSIDRVVSAGGESKKGALRCIIYNPHSQSLRYYFLPKERWVQYVLIHPTSKIGSIQYSYNRVKDTITKFSDYECSSFYELARCSS